MSPMWSRGARLLLLCTLPWSSGTGAQTTDATALYVDRCGRCHGLGGPAARADAPAGVLIKVVMLPPGPDLTGIYGRPAGRSAEYTYSGALLAAAKAGLVWNRDNLDRWLTNSRAMIPGTYMLVKLPRNERRIIIDLLAAHGE